MCLVASLLFIALAAIANAVMDNVSHHPSLSVLRNVWGGWWIRDWRYKYVDLDPAKGRVKWNILGVKVNRPVQITDGWHFSKMCMVIFLAMAAAVAACSDATPSWLLFAAMVIAGGTTWNTTFVFFYKRVLRSGNS